MQKAPIENIFEETLLNEGKFFYLPSDSWEKYAKAKAKGLHPVSFGVQLRGSSHQARKWQERPLWGVLIAIEEDGHDLFRPHSTSLAEWTELCEKIAERNGTHPEVWSRKDLIILPSKTVVAIDLVPVNIVVRTGIYSGPDASETGFLCVLNEAYRITRLRKLRRQAEDHLRKNLPDIVRVSKFLNMK